LLIKTDSAGNQQWIKYLDINNNQHDGGGAMALTNDGNILYAYGYATYTYFHNEYKDARLNIIKFSMDGTQLWNKMYDTIRFDLNAVKIQVLPDNNFIVMGSFMEMKNENYYTSYLFKFNANGDSLWRRTYFYSNYISSLDLNLLADNVLNVDGGITACGWVQGDTLVPSQQIWILKTDSTGYAPGPQNVGIIDLPYLQVGYGGIKVYPNPATDFIIAEYKIDKAAKEVLLVISDMQGRLQMKKQLTTISYQALIDIRNLQNGSYNCTIIVDGQQKAVTKLIVQH